MLDLLKERHHCPERCHWSYERMQKVAVAAFEAKKRG